MVRRSGVLMVAAVTGLVNADLVRAETVWVETQGLEVTLVDPGEPPRQRVRYDLREGVAERVVFVSDRSDTMLMNGEPTEDVDLPALRQTAEIVVLKTTDNGVIEATIRLVESDLEGAPLAPSIRHAVEQGLLQARMEMTSLGTIKTITVDFPKETSPLARQVLRPLIRHVEQLSLPLPAEPIGVGAQWRTEYVVETARGTFDRTIDAQVAQLDDRSLKIEFSLTSSLRRNTAPPIVPPNLPAVKVLKDDGVGSGVVTLHLEKAAPSSSMLKIERAREESVEHQGESYFFKTKTVQSLRTRRAALDHDEQDSE